MTKIKWPILLFLIIFLATVLRFWQLGKVPPSLDWDEASIGYNAYSLLTTGSDEYGTMLPISIRSFEDYKPPAYVYAAIPSIAIFGLNEFAVRFPSALTGTLTVLATFFLVRNLFRLDKSANNRFIDLLSYCVTVLLAFSPWHIQFSRLAFEANLALFFIVCGSLFLLKFLHRPTWYSLFISTLSYTAALYSYHSARLFVPLFVLGIALFYYKTFLKNIKTTVLNIIFGGVLLLPLVFSIFNTAGVQARFGEVSIFSSAGLRDVVKTTMDAQKEYWQSDQANGDLLGRAFHSKYVSYSRLLAKNYLDHLNFNFLFLNADSNGRHHAPDMGLLYLIESPLILIGGFILVTKRCRYFFFLLWWFLMAPLAAALTADTPHAVRSLVFLPVFQFLTAFGLLQLISQIRQISPIPLAAFSIGFLFFLNVFYFLHQYFVHLPIEYATSYQYGYKEMVTKVKDRAANYDEIYVTTKYDQPYIYFLFYGNVDPHFKNDGTWNKVLGKYHFVNWGEIPNEQKSQLSPAVLAVHGADDFFTPKVIEDHVYYPDGKVAFVISHM